MHGLSESEADDSDSPNSPPIINQKYWQSKGKILGQCVEMWDTFYGILDQGVSRNPDIDEDFMHTDLDNQRYKKFRLLVTVAPEMAKLLEKADSSGLTGPGFTKALDEVIDTGHKRARRVDISGIRGAIGQWLGIIWEPASPAVWHLLGFNHQTTGKFLCPVTLDWGDPNVRERLRRGLEELTSTDLPAFLWSNGTFSIEDPYKGFLRGSLLAMSYKHIFISPSSTKQANKSTHGGNAALHGISFVTYESIAYVATVTWFALSDEPVFNHGGDDNKKQPGFPYCEFYHELIEHQSLMSSEELCSLIQWWNGVIFPRSVYASGDVKKDSAGAMMQERVRARQMELEAAREATVSGVTLVMTE
ncbi:hypothetical protein EDB87DRAFT_1692848 [Lactarius vividus]|nr:hypothetical protein EDB87DRAFT_1692848 [Lactarius vividus]